MTRPALALEALDRALQGRVSSAERTVAETLRTEFEPMVVQRVLDADPDNLHALANATTFLFRRGELAEADGLATRLRALEPDDLDGLVTKAEAFSYLGDDAAVMESYDRAAALADGSDEAPALPADLVQTDTSSAAWTSPILHRTTWSGGARSGTNRRCL